MRNFVHQFQREGIRVDKKPQPATLRYRKSASGHGIVAFEASMGTTVRESLFDLGFSRAAVGRLAACGQLVYPDGHPIAPSAHLDAGDAFAVRIAVSEERPCASRDESVSLPEVPVLYEDPFVVAVAKPASLLVHGDGTGALTLTDAVNAHLRAAGALQPAQALQRLDKETTGVVLFSKTAEFQCLFDALVAGDGMSKRYLAIAQGRFNQSTCVYTDAIGRDRHNAQRMRVTDKGGQTARTYVERLGVAGDGSCSLLAVTLGTGRRHQIRVHLSAHGHPLVGDALYGYDGPRVGGLMLHAYAESFVHPITGESVRIVAGWPQRFSRWFDATDAEEVLHGTC